MRSAANGRHDDANSYGTRRQIAVLCGQEMMPNEQQQWLRAELTQSDCVTADEAALLTDRSDDVDDVSYLTTFSSVHASGFDASITLATCHVCPIKPSGEPGRQTVLIRYYTGLASVRLSICLSVSSAYSPWLTKGSMRCGQRTFRPDNKEDRRLVKPKSRHTSRPRE